MNKLQKRSKKFNVFLATLLLLCMVFLGCTQGKSIQADRLIGLNYSKLVMSVGKKCQLKLNGASKSKVTWYSSNHKVATISKGKVTAKKVGKVTITAKYKSKKYKCQVTVIKKLWPDTPTPKPTKEAVSPSANPNSDTKEIVEGGAYTTKMDVANYIHQFGKLPSNFITKKEAQALGWPGGGLDDYAYGKCIGGDYFGNYEDKLPENDTYHECDIDTLHASSRGAKRIIYSESGKIFYTEDHYNSFQEITF